MKDAPDIKEIEINPIMVGKDYACCADALINISSAEA
jgi:succinyl-CoA synthetase beta subunit